MKSLNVLALSVMVLAGAPAMAKDQQCLVFDTTEGLPPSKISRFFAARALAIVRAALSNDADTLSQFVAPTAKFETWRGDSAEGGREAGVAGAAKWARGLHPTRYEIALSQPDMVIIKKSPVCDYSSTLLFRTDLPQIAVAVEFEFVDGLLVRATGHQLRLIEGSVQ